MKALSHATDPATSLEAADRIEETGAADTHRQIVLRLLRLWPGATASEITRRLMERYGSHQLYGLGFKLCPDCRRLQVMKRLSDLHREGAVVQSGCGCVTCSPVDHTMKAKGGESTWMAAR